MMFNTLKQTKTNKRLVTSIGTLMLVVISMYITSCRPLSTSQIQTLDNLSQKDGKFSVNSCGPSDGYGVFSQYASRIVFDGTIDENFKQAIGQALLAVPSELRYLIFKLNTTIHIKDKSHIQNICSIASKEEKSLFQESYNTNIGFSVCWIKPQKSYYPQIYIEKSIPAIKHSMIRIFAYLYTQFVIPTLLQDNSYLAFVESSNIDKLANTFISEINASPSKFNSLNFINKIPFQIMKNFIFADAVDSFYCTPNTLHSFQTNFTQTYSVFIGSNTNEVSTSSFAYKLGKPWFAQ